MAKKSLENLSRRERQIMDIIYRLKKATVAEVMENLSDAPSYSTVRALLRILEEKKYLRHKTDGPRYVFLPRMSREKAKRSAVKNLLQTFFNNSAASAVATLLDVSKSEMTDKELDRLQSLIELAKKEGR